MSQAFAVFLGALISAGILFFNNWLQRRWEKKKWLIDKKEKAYLECLNQLTFSRRVPVAVKVDDHDEDCLERDDYLGAMASFQHVPTWMIMIQNYSTKESGTKIRPKCEEIGRIFKQLKSREREIIEKDGKKFVRELGMSAAVESALQVVADLSEKELLNSDPCLCQRLGCAK